MSIFNNDRSTYNETAKKFDSDLSVSCFDFALQQAFKAGMNLDEIMYITISHTERVVQQQIVQNKLKRAASKEKDIPKNQ